jgi:glucuronate isomerase
VATDHSAVSPLVERLPRGEAETIFARALRGEVGERDAERFTAHVLAEMARMSVEDGLVMQLHVGSFRNHNELVYARFGPDNGSDLPVRTGWTRELHALLNEFGNDPRFGLIVFTLDEGAYSRELAPLAGHYPAMLLGAPWWFFDSPLGMRRYLDRVVETAGIYNTAGFNDDTRAFASIPARHDVWRRVTCDWLAGMVVTGVVDEEDAREMAYELAYGLAKSAYRLDAGPVRSVR